MRRFIPTLLVACSLSLSPLLHAEEVTLPFNGITLNADLEGVNEGNLEQVVLITHGTLAHKDMEIIQSWQELLADEEIPSLAINLSLGLDNRKGMYDCATEHSHKHTDAIDEINVWVEWLTEKKGAESIILAAHSRGGNQTAWFSNQINNDNIKGQILLAPQTWSEDEEKSSYEERYKQPLAPILANALQQKTDNNLNKTDFIYCEDTEVKASSFISYYQPDNRFDTPTLLKKATIPTLVIAGSEDTTVKDLAGAMESINNSLVTTLEIEGADHFFRDLYMDEVIEYSLEFMEQL